MILVYAKTSFEVVPFEIRGKGETIRISLLSDLALHIPLFPWWISSSGCGKCMPKVQKYGPRIHCDVVFVFCFCCFFYCAPGKAWRNLKN